MKTRLSITVSLILISSCYLFSRILSDEYDDSFKEHEILIQADSLANIWQYEKAIVNFELAKDLFLVKDSWEAYVYSMSRLGEMYLKIGNLDRSLYFLEEAKKMGLEKLGEEHPEVGRVYFHLSDYYRDTMDDNKSLELCKKSLEIRKKQLDSNHLDLAESFFQLGTRCFNKREISETIKHYQEGIRIFENRLDPSALRLGRAYRYYAYIINDFHDSERAFFYLLEAQKIYDVHPEAAPVDGSPVYNNLANRYFDKEEYALAIPLYKRTIELFTSVYGPNSPSLVTPLGNLGTAYTYLAKDVKTRKTFSKAFSIVEQQTEEIQYNFGTLYAQYADFYLERNQPDSALIHIKKAIYLEFQLSSRNKSNLASLMNQKADAFLKKNELDSSLIYIQKSLIYLEKDFETENHYANPSITNSLVPDKLYMALSMKADIFYHLYKKSDDVSLLKESVSLYAKLDSLTDQMRNEIWSEGSKLFFKKYYKQDADKALSAICQLDTLLPHKKHKNLVFKFMEKNRYSKIYNNQSKALNLSKSENSDSMYHNLQIINSQFDEVKNTLSSESDSLLMDSLDSIRFRLSREAEILQSELSKKYPNQFNINYGNMMSLSEVQKRLNRTTQILEYSWGNTTIFALVISKTEANLFQIPLSDSLRKNISTFKKFVSHQGSEPLNTSDIKSFSTIAHYLYSELIEPLLILGKKQLIISPDGDLSSLPFGALMTESVATSWSSAPYLIKEFNIQFALNFNLLYSPTTSKKKSTPDLLAFAYTDSLKDSVLGNSNNRGNTLNPIQGSSKELDTINLIFRGDRHVFLKGRDATETAFKNHIEDFNIVHLALHGRADDKNELNPCLYFRDPPTSQDDGQLFAHELYRYNLSNLNLAVLSACESGIGKEVKGEGIFNMARGFAVAGCESTVMSLWKISDKITAKVMSPFYKNLKNGDHIHNALRNAQLEYIDNPQVDRLAHPYYWSAFIPIGKSSPVCFNQNTNLILGILAVALLILFAFFILKRPKT